MGNFDLRPRTVGEVLDGAIRLAVGNARTLIPLVACVVVPLQVAWAIVLLVTTSHGNQVPGTVFDLHFHFVREPNGSVRNIGAPRVGTGGTVAELIVTPLAQLLSTAACVRALADVASGAAPSIAVSLAAAVRRLPALIVLFVTRLVGELVGLILLIVPGVWLAGSWSVSVPACMLEGAGPGHALRRSTRLVSGRWWPVVAVLIVADLAATLASGALQALFGAIDGWSAHPALGAAVLALVLGTVVAELLVQPFTAAVHIVLYLDLRVRRGGEELAALAHQLGVPVPEIAPPPRERAPGDPPYWPPPPGWRPEEQG